MSTDISLPHPPSGGSVSQGTLIEFSRVAAEVEAAIRVAQLFPRVVDNVIRDVEEICGIKEVAEVAFYRYPRGGKTVEGPTIKLMLELARVWGNMQWNIVELSRTGTGSEVLSYAWDCQTNARSARIVIVPSKRDRSGETVDLESMRDVLNNNTNIGSRQLREAIEQILPGWLVLLATKKCKETLAHGGGIPLPQRRSEIAKRFRDKFGVTVEQLERKLHNRKIDHWDGYDLATLKISWDSLRRGDVTVDQEFPEPRVTSELLAEAAGSGGTEPGDEPSRGDAAESPQRVRILGELPTDRDGLNTLLMDLFLAAGVPADSVGREKRIAAATHILGLEEAPATLDDLPVEQLSTLVDDLRDAYDDDGLISLVEVSCERWRARFTPVEGE